MNATDYDRVKDIIGQIGPMLVAYSGGVDSALLLKAAVDQLGDAAIGVTAVSASLADVDRRRAAEVARWIGARHIEIETAELDDPRYAANNSNRCYFCKSELFERLARLGGDLGIGAIVYGANRDDLGDFRPGMDAARQAGVRAPLLEAGLGKLQIRDISRHLGLPTWDLPARPCLSSRIPHGTPVTVERLGRIERAEDALRDDGFRVFRVRDHDDVARLEIAADEMARLTDPGLRERISSRILAAGFRYVAVELGGYRPGSLNPMDSSASVTPVTGETAPEPSR